MSGSCAIGMERSETNPAIAVTSAMTTASRGRSTKIDENIASAADRPFSRYSHHNQPRPQTLHASLVDEFAPGKPFCNDDGGTQRLPYFDAPDRRFSILNNEHIDALLISDQRSLRYNDSFLRFIAFDADLNELPINQPSFRIWQRRTHCDGIGSLIDLHVHEIDLARVWIDRTV